MPRAMRPPFSRIRPEEWRDTMGAALTVLVVLLAHALLETARDALFLARLPVTRLPWMYLVLAVVGVGLAEASSRGSARFDARKSVIAAQVFAAVGTVILWGMTRFSSTYVYYALYIWSGVASMSILVQFWLYLGERFTATQAKRLFPIIGSGSAVGALIGYAAAGAIARRAGAETLLWASGGIFLLSAAGPLLFERSRTHGRNVAEKPVAPPRPGVRDSVSTAVYHPYVRRVALILLLSSVTVTLVDFAFKSTVARTIPADDLVLFFARFHLVFNAVSLMALLTVATPLVRRVGVTGTLAILPVAIMAGGVGMTIVGGILAASCLKGADSAFRWSTHKTAAELLYVPLSSELRNTVKSVIDLVTHRGGQAIGSFLILGGLAVTDDERVFGPLIVAGAGLWCYFAITSREAYLDLFRDSLSQGAVETHLDFPDLDVGSLESLMAALNASDDKKVVAAIDILERKCKAHLVPALILYHPSPTVVVRALDLFAQAKRTDFLAIAPRIADHEYAEVRAAALRAMTAVRPDPDVLRRALKHHCPVVNVTAMVGLTAGGWSPPEDALAELLRHAEQDSALARPMIARALRYRPIPGLAPVLLRLAHAPELETRREAVLAMRAARDECFIPTLIELLRERSLREDVRVALLELGDPALAALEAALADLSIRFRVRVHLPRTISRFQGQRAAEILARHLLIERRGMVRYKTLRGLGRLIANDPSLPLDRGTLDEVTHRTATSCFRAVHWRSVLEQGAKQDPERRTSGHELLMQLLWDKERHSIERLFRTLSLRFRSEDVARIYDGLTSSSPSLRSSSRELLESTLPLRLGTAVLGLTDDVPANIRLDAGLAYYEPDRLDYVELLALLAVEPSPTLRSIATYHAAEIGLSVEAPADLAEAEQDEPLAGLRVEAVEMLRDGSALPGGTQRET